ncbi:MAG: restriction endonuclease subunit S [Cyanobacteria bacterium P01_C01_bin.118]
MGEQESLEKLPDSWTWVVLEDLITGGIQNGLYLPKSSYGSGTPILRIDDFQDDFSRDAQQLQKVSAQKDEVEKYGLQECDLIINRVNSPSHLGKCLVITPKHLPALFESNMMRLRLSKQACVPFVAFYLRSVGGKSRLIENAKWAVNQASINQKDVGSTAIPLPPSEEQYRIVNKIEELFTQLDAGVDLLKKLKVKLKRYRQAVLKAAVEGKLTQDWRKKQQQRGQLKSVDTLLTHIKTEREQCYQKLLDVWQTEVEFWEAHGKVGKRPSKPKKLKDLSALNQNDLSDLRILPDGWFWAKLGNVSIKIQIGPFGSLLHKADYITGGIPAINPTHINDLKINVDTNFTVTQKKFDELKKYSLEEGDIIMGRRGEMGRCALVTEKEDGFLCGTGSLYIRSAKSLNSFYYSYFLSSRDTKTYLEHHSIGTTMRNLNENILNEIPVPVCSYLEQEKIVEEIEACFSICDRIETDIISDLKKAEKLRQSILKRAFEGKLVPQDPNDEPASLLLERIQTEKAQQEAKSKKRKTTTKNKKTRKTTKTKQLEITDASNEEQAS